MLLPFLTIYIVKFSRAFGAQRIGNQLENISHGAKESNMGCTKVVSHEQYNEMKPFLFGNGVSIFF